jgi:hypothetical protein
VTAAEKPRDEGDGNERARPDDPGRPRRAERDAVRRQRRARVFGDTLPDATRDERGDSWGERDGDADEWLRRQVPPHHHGG